MSFEAILADREERIPARKVTAPVDRICLRLICAFVVAVLPLTAVSYVSRLVC